MLSCVPILTHIAWSSSLNCSLVIAHLACANAAFVRNQCSSCYECINIHWCPLVQTGAHWCPLVQLPPVWHVPAVGHDCTLLGGKVLHSSGMTQNVLAGRKGRPSTDAYIPFYPSVHPANVSYLNPQWASKCGGNLC